MTTTVSRHSQPDGVWCPWSLIAVADDYDHDRCPARCPDSTVECTREVPDATWEQTFVVHVSIPAYGGRGQLSTLDGFQEHLAMWMDDLAWKMHQIYGATSGGGVLVRQAADAIAARLRPLVPDGIVLTRDQVQQWTGRELDDDDLRSLESWLPHSSIPDAFGVMAEQLEDQ